MRLLAKYQPKMSPNVRTIYGRAAIGCCSHTGSPLGTKKSNRDEKISPQGREQRGWISKAGSAWFVPVS